MAVVHTCIRGLFDKRDAGVGAVSIALSEQNPVGPRGISAFLTRIESVTSLVILECRQEINFSFIKSGEYVAPLHLPQQLVVLQNGVKVIVIQLVNALHRRDREGYITLFQQFF